MSLQPSRFRGMYCNCCSIVFLVSARKNLRKFSGIGPVACAVLSGDLQLLPTLLEMRANLRSRAPRLGLRYGCEKPCDFRNKKQQVFELMDKKHKKPFWEAHKCPYQVGEFTNLQEYVGLGHHSWPDPSAAGSQAQLQSRSHQCIGGLARWYQRDGSLGDQCPGTLRDTRGRANPHPAKGGAMGEQKCKQWIQVCQIPFSC